MSKSPGKYWSFKTDGKFKPKQVDQHKNFMAYIAKPPEPIKGIAKKAYCHSRRCNTNGNHKDYISAKGKLKDGLNQGTVYCPDCNHALEWRRT